MKKIDIVSIILWGSIGILVLMCCGYCIPSWFPWRSEKIYFENVLFEWDDDHDRYDIMHQEINEQGYDSMQHYYVASSKAVLVYSEEDWCCFGEIVVDYNAWGRQLNKYISNFTINVYRER